MGYLFLIGSMTLIVFFLTAAKAAVVNTERDSL
jgi:hypothetical protein